MKKILVIYYSQSGQLSDLVENFTKPLVDDENFELTFKNIQPKKSFPFPWDLISFMSVFPESAHLIPCELEEIEDDNVDFDLVIIAYQVWFLSPSIPISSFMQSSYAKKHLKDKAVITLIGCRNMWIMAQEKMKEMLKKLNATLIDNVVLVDQGNSLETFITTPRWMLSGKKDSFLGLSEAGISKKDIKNSARFARAIKDAMLKDLHLKKQPLLSGLGAVEVDVSLINSEKIGNKSFMIWGGVIKKLQGNSRKVAVVIYLAFLLLMIVTVVPINMLIQAIIRRVNQKSFLKQKYFYEMPSGSSKERLEEFL